ncbi:MAG TPA: hypothetical protein VGL72_10920, partial [Bryobacteraceae bacterium]
MPSRDNPHRFHDYFIKQSNNIEKSTPDFTNAHATMKSERLLCDSGSPVHLYRRANESFHSRET